jgi:hypothetical protein
MRLPLASTRSRTEISTCEAQKEAGYGQMFRAMEIEVHGAPEAMGYCHCFLLGVRGNRRARRDQCWPGVCREGARRDTLQCRRIVPDRDGKDFATSHVMLDIDQNVLLTQFNRGSSDPGGTTCCRSALDVRGARAVDTLL